MTSRDTAPAWLAGFVLGEGCFRLIFPGTKRGRASPRALCVDIGAANTDFELIYTASRFLTERGIKHFVTSPVFPKGHKPWIAFKITSKKATQMFLLWIRPFLVGKKAEQADLILEFLNRACAVSRYYPTPADYALAERIRDLKDKSHGERLDRLLQVNAERTAAPSAASV